MASLQILVGDNTSATNSIKQYFSKQFQGQINANGEQVKIYYITPSFDSDNPAAVGNDSDTSISLPLLQLSGHDCEHPPIKARSAANKHCVRLMPRLPSIWAWTTGMPPPRQEALSRLRMTSLCCSHSIPLTATAPSGSCIPPSPLSPLYTAIQMANTLPSWHREITHTLQSLTSSSTSRCRIPDWLLRPRHLVGPWQLRHLLGARSTAALLRCSAVVSSRDAWLCFLLL